MIYKVVQLRGIEKEPKIENQEYYNLTFLDMTIDKGEPRTEIQIKMAAEEFERLKTLPGVDNGIVGHNFRFLLRLTDDNFGIYFRPISIHSSNDPRHVMTCEDTPNFTSRENWISCEGWSDTKARKAEVAL